MLQEGLLNSEASTTMVDLMPSTTYGTRLPNDVESYTQYLHE